MSAADWRAERDRWLSSPLTQLRPAEVERACRDATRAAIKAGRDWSGRMVNISTRNILIVGGLPMIYPVVIGFLLTNRRRASQVESWNDRVV